MNISINLDAEEQHTLQAMIMHVLSLRDAQEFHEVLGLEPEQEDVLSDTIESIATKIGLTVEDTWMRNADFTSTKDQLCADNVAACARRRTSTDNTCAHYPEDEFALCKGAIT